MIYLINISRGRQLASGRVNAPQGSRGAGKWMDESECTFTIKLWREGTSHVRLALVSRGEGYLDQFRSAVAAISPRDLSIQIFSTLHITT